jgi:glyoxylase-like metal-dependent hydrolase (beta-lactamase superfamily II)
LTFVIDGILFTGDALFRGTIGRTDLSGGDHNLLIKSITDKIMTFNDNTLVYPGHGESTTIGFERKRNPFLQGFKLKPSDD